MDKETDFHNRANKIKSIKKRIELGEGLTKKNKELLKSYFKELHTQHERNKLSLGGFEKSLYEAYNLCKNINKDINKANKEDFKAWFDKIEKKVLKGELSEWTIRKYFSQGRKFIRFVYGFEDEKQYIDFYDPLRKLLPNKPKNRLSASDLISVEDTKKLLRHIRNNGTWTGIRNSAFIAMLWDTGARPSELMALKNKQFKKEKNYLIVSIKESKSIPRDIIVYGCLEYLEDWSKINPSKNDPEGYFFCNSKKENVNYHALKREFDKALKRAELKFPRNVGMYMFRNCFISRCIWEDRFLRYWVGHSQQGSQAHYLALNYMQIVPHYFQMLKDCGWCAEKPSWEDEQDNNAEKLLDSFLGSEVGRLALKQWAKKLSL